MGGKTAEHPQTKVFNNIDESRELRLGKLEVAQVDKFVSFGRVWLG